MNLDEFIENSLLQIIKGVRSAQKKSVIKNKALGEGDLINPKVLNNADSVPKGKDYITFDKDLVQMVEFDIAVTASKDSLESLGSGIKVAGLGGFGGKLKKVVTSSDVSRIKFKVPIILPSSKHEE